MTQENLNEPVPEVSSDLELATKDVYRQACEDATQWELGNHPVTLL